MVRSSSLIARSLGITYSLPPAWAGPGSGAAGAVRGRVRAGGDDECDPEADDRGARSPMVCATVVAAELISVCGASSDASRRGVDGAPVGLSAVPASARLPDGFMTASALGGDVR